jgi:hypothetical protein
MTLPFDPINFREPDVIVLPPIIPAFTVLMLEALRRTEPVELNPSEPTGRRALPPS